MFDHLNMRIIVYFMHESHCTENFLHLFIFILNASYIFTVKKFFFFNIKNIFNQEKEEFF